MQIAPPDTTRPGINRCTVSLGESEIPQAQSFYPPLVGPNLTCSQTKLSLRHSEGGKRSNDALTNCLTW